ncbi:MAG: IclR family transcriptional regulator, partial [Caulobacterales bacterium]|nr:IclR family transcriptional regulator [Caulobacterales bacterium]
DDERRGVQSVEVSARLLAALAAADHALALKDVSEAAGVPPSNTHRYLSSFIKTGLVKQEPATGLYDLGPAALRLGVAALSRYEVIDETHAALKALSEQSGATALISHWSEHGPTVVRWVRARRPFVTSLNLGSVLPVLTSATGQVFLAYLPDALTERLVRAEMAAAKRQVINAGGVETLKQVRAIKQSIQTSGCATADGSVIPGLCAVAAPVLNIQGEAALVATLIGADRKIIEPNHSVRGDLLAICRSLSLAPLTTV